MVILLKTENTMIIISVTNTEHLVLPSKIPCTSHAPFNLLIYLVKGYFSHFAEKEMEAHIPDLLCTPSLSLCCSRGIKPWPCFYILSS